MEGFLCYRFGAAYIWKGLYMGGLIFGILRYASHANLVGSFHRVSKLKNNKIFSRHIFEKNSVICIAPVRFIRPFHTSSHTNPLCIATKPLPTHSLLNKTLLVSGATLPQFLTCIALFKEVSVTMKNGFLAFSLWIKLKLS